MATTQSLFTDYRVRRGGPRLQEIFLPAEGIDPHVRRALTDYLTDITNRVNNLAIFPYGIVNAQDDFGATGDGVTDDTAAIQAAIDAAFDTGPHTRVFLPPGDYVTSSTIFPKGVAIIGSNLSAQPTEGSWPTQIRPNIAKSTEVVATDITVAQSTLTTAGAVDFSVFSDNDILLVRGGTANDHKVVTVNGSPSTTVITVNEATNPGILATEAASASITISKLTPVFEDGKDIQSRASADGTIFRGVAIVGQATTATNWGTVIADEDLVVGYKGGLWRDITTEHNTRGDYQLAVQGIAAGMFLTGWQSHVDFYSQLCPMGFAGSSLNGGTTRVDGDKNGDVRYADITGGELYTHNPGADTWRVRQDSFIAINGMMINCRAEGTAATTRHLDFRFLRGCLVMLHTSGAGVLTEAFVNAQDCQSSIFLGRVNPATSGTEVNFSGSVDDCINHIYINGSIPTGSGAERFVYSDGDTGGAASAGSGNQYVEMNVEGTVYKFLHDGTV